MLSRDYIDNLKSEIFNYEYSIKRYMGGVRRSDDRY